MSSELGGEGGQKTAVFWHKRLITQYASHAAIYDAF